MKNRPLIGSGLLLMGIPLSNGVSAQKVSVKQEKKPNVLFILADDLGYGDLSCYGQEKFETPHIDKLAQAGVRFTQCYAGCTVSAPSRSALLTGTHSGRTPIRGNVELQPEGQFPLPAGTHTLFHTFKEAGYQTAAFGKWGLGFVGSTGDPLKQGVDRFYGYNCQLLAHSYYPDHLWDNDQRVELTDNVAAVPYGKGSYSQDLIHAKALEFLNQTATDEPFFLFYPTTLPHAELLVPEDSIIRKFRGKYPETPYKGVDSGPTFRRGGYCSQPEPRATFAAMVYRLDQYVGQLVERLKERGLYENTIIIFASDNGPHREGGADPDFFNSNGIWRGYKRDLYEGGIRVPMIISWPKQLPEGRETDLICSFWDLMPTFEELLNTKDVRIKREGISLLPLLENRTGQEEHDYLYFEFMEMNGRQAVRKGPWKLIHLNIRGEQPTFELYNLTSDPSEKENLIDAYPQKAAELKTILQIAHQEDPAWPLFHPRRSK